MSRVSITYNGFTRDGDDRRPPRLVCIQYKTIHIDVLESFGNLSPDLDWRRKLSREQRFCAKIRIKRYNISTAYYYSCRNIKNGGFIFILFFFYYFYRFILIYRTNEVDVPPSKGRIEIYARDLYAGAKSSLVAKNHNM